MSANAPRPPARPPALPPAPSLDDYRTLFAVAPEHALGRTGGKRTERHGRTRECDWFEERDARGRLIACYRAWRERGARPPHRTESGWERWSPRGELLDREVRFSNRASVAALH